jgi:hypothetical protein
MARIVGADDGDEHVETVSCSRFYGGMARRSGGHAVRAVSAPAAIQPTYKRVLAVPKR